MNILILNKRYTEVTRERDPDDSWDDDDICTTNNITGISIAGKNNYYDLAVPFDIEPGKIYHLVYATYSTGDSFHHEEGCIQYVDLFQTYEKAMECVMRLEAHHHTYTDYDTYRPNKKREKLPKDYDTYTCMLEDDTGKEYKFHVSWHGYFEHLSSIEVRPVSLTTSYKREY